MLQVIALIIEKLFNKLVEYRYSICQNNTYANAVVSMQGVDLLCRQNITFLLIYSKL